MTRNAFVFFLANSSRSASSRADDIPWLSAVAVCHSKFFLKWNRAARLSGASNTKRPDAELVISVVFCVIRSYRFTDHVPGGNFATMPFAALSVPRTYSWPGQAIARHDGL